MVDDMEKGPLTQKHLYLQLFTLLRIPLAMVLATVLLYCDHHLTLVIVVCVFIVLLIELTDMLDGLIARRAGIVSEFGAMLDPYADSISRLIVYWGFACAGLVIALVPLAMAFRDITVAYCRITLTRFDRSVSAKLSGKIKAVIQGVGAIVIILGPLYWRFTGKWTIAALSWVVVSVTLVSIIEYAAAAISAADAERRAK